MKMRDGKCHDSSKRCGQTLFRSNSFSFSAAKTFTGSRGKESVGSGEHRWCTSLSSWEICCNFRHVAAFAIIVIAAGFKTSVTVLVHLYIALENSKHTVSNKMVHYFMFT